METQVQQLKLNVSNIKSYLIRSNKELKGLRVQKRDLFSRIEKKREFQEEEKRIETPNLGIGAGFAKISSAVTSPVRSIFDQILDFFGLIALGIIVNKLPEIINTIDNFFNSDFIKGVSSILETIGTAFTNLGRFVGLIPEDKQNEHEKDLKDIDKNLDESTKDFDQFDEKAKQLENFLEPLTSNITKLINDLNKKNNEKPDEQSGGEMGGSNEPDSPSRLNTGPEPPSGTGGPTGGPIPKPKPPEQKLSTGGTVRGDAKTDPIKNKPIHQPKQTPELKRAKRSAQDGFTGFGLAVNNISEAIGKDEENVKSFAELAEKIRILNVANSGISTSGRGSPKNTPPGSPGAPGVPGTNYPGQTSGGTWIGPTGDTDKQDTGLNMALPGGIGTPILAPFDLIYKTTGTDGNPSVGLDGTAGVLGPAGRGFGYYGAYFFKKDGKEYEVLLGHFRDLPYKGSKNGEIIPKGTILGYQGASGRSVSNGGPFPHISLHINGADVINGVRSRNNDNGILVDFAKKLTSGGSNISPAQVKNPPPGVSLDPPDPVGSGVNQLLNTLQRPYGKGGNTRILNNRSSSGNQSLFIYAVQPVETYVPFPYPMPVPQETAQSSPEPVKLPSIWRA